MLCFMVYHTFSEIVFCSVFNSHERQSTFPSKVGRCIFNTGQYLNHSDHCLYPLHWLFHSLLLPSKCIQPPRLSLGLPLFYLYIASHIATILLMNLKSILSIPNYILNNRFAFLLPHSHCDMNSSPGIQIIPEWGHHNTKLFLSQSSTTQYMASPFPEVIKTWELFLSPRFASIP